MKLTTDILDQPLGVILSKSQRAGPPLVLGLALLAVVMWSLTWVLPVAIVLLLTIVLTSGYCAVIFRHLWRTREENDSSRRDTSTLLDRQVRNSRRISILDPDTALLQRWYFELRVAEEAARCQRYGLTMVVALVQADGERVNSAEDVELFPILARTLRSADLATRLSRAEYAFCLPHTSEEGAKSAVQRLVGKKQVSAVSVGYAICPRDGEDLDELLSHASKNALGKAFNGTQNRQDRYLQIVESIRQEGAGELAIGEAETAKGLKLSLRHAARRVGVDLNIWEVDGRVYFERVTSKPTAAESSAA